MTSLRRCSPSPVTEYLAYERLRNAISALGGSLEHRREGGPQGGTWVLRLGGYTLEIPCEAARFRDLDQCYRLKPGIAFARSFSDYGGDIDPVGVARLFERLLRTSPAMARTGPPLAETMQRTLEVRLKERLAAATEDFRRVFGYAPGRWLQMESESGTLGACQRILAPGEYVSQLTPLWEKKRLHQSVEAIVLEPEFGPLFTDVERKVARERLKALGFEAP